MRIVAGSRKGHGIAAPKGVVTRPTGDRVRESAFAIVGPVDGARVLDLFAGSGAMGLEALSRGASRCVFVERDREACRVIERNLEKLRQETEAFTNKREEERLAALHGGPPPSDDTNGVEDAGAEDTEESATVPNT